MLENPVYKAQFESFLNATNHPQLKTIDITKRDRELFETNQAMEFLMLISFGYISG